MDGFLLSENIGRQKFNTLCNVLKGKNKIQKYKFTEDRYCPIDAVVKINDGKYGVEIKNINYIQDRYFIKVEKFNSIKQYCLDNKIKKAIYVVFVGNTVYTIDLFKIPEISSVDTLFLQKTNVKGGEKFLTPCYRFSVKEMKKWKI